VPWQGTLNSFIETFNGSLRDDCLNVHLLTSLDEAKAIVEAWRIDYNEIWPLMAHNGMPPGEFARRHKDLKESTNGRNVES
jgi:putative transposase